MRDSLTEREGGGRERIEREREKEGERARKRKRQIERKRESERERERENLFYFRHLHATMKRFTALRHNAFVNSKLPFGLFDAPMFKR